MSVLSSDAAADPDTLAINAASAALAASDVPCAGPAGAVRVASTDGRLVVNPKPAVAADADLDLLYVGTADRALLMSVEVRFMSASQPLCALQSRRHYAASDGGSVGSREHLRQVFRTHRCNRPWRVVGVGRVCGPAAGRSQGVDWLLVSSLHVSHVHLAHVCCIAVWMQAREAPLSAVRDALAGAHKSAALLLPPQARLASRAGRGTRAVRPPLFLSQDV